MTAVPYNLTDSEFVRLHRDACTSDLEKLLLERLISCMDELETAKEAMPACGPGGADVLENFDSDELVDELRDRLGSAPTGVIHAHMKSLVAGIGCVELVCK